jgi:hypothetical protein
MPQFGWLLVLKILLLPLPNTKTGYNGADYDLYVEVASGKLSGYLYQLSSTGIYKILKSINLTQSFADPNALRGAVSLELPLSFIIYPSKYNLLFYTAESYKSKLDNLLAG